MFIKKIKLVEVEYSYHLKLSVVGESFASSHTIKEVPRDLVNYMAKLAQYTQSILKKTNLNVLGFAIKKKKDRKGKKEYIYANMLCNTNHNGYSCGLSTEILLGKFDPQVRQSLFEAEHYEEIERYETVALLTEAITMIDNYVKENYNDLVANVLKDEATLFTNA